MTIRKTLTGSTGNSLSDSGIRGLIAGALTAGLTVGARKTGVLTAEDVGDLSPVIIFVGFLAGGLFDRYLRSRLM